MKNEYLLYGSYDKIYMFNINNYKLYKCFDVEGYDIGLCKFNENMIISGNVNGYIIIYKLENDNLEKIFEKKKTHSSNINNFIILKKKFIISCSDDKSFKIWK